MCSNPIEPIPARLHDPLPEIVSQLQQAIAENTPRFAIQRLLSDLVVHLTLLLRSRNPCPIRDAEFLHHLSALEIAVARSQSALTHQHLAAIRQWLDGRAAPEFVTPFPPHPHQMI